MTTWGPLENGDPVDPLSGGQITFPQTDVATGMLIVAAGLLGGAAASWFPARSASDADILDVLRAD